MSLVDAEAGRAHTYTFGVLARARREVPQQGHSRTGTLNSWTEQLLSLYSSDQRVQEGALNAVNVDQSY